MKKNKGFTLVELVIVIIIVGILSIVSLTIYRKNINKAKMTEGKALLSAIIDAEEIRYSNPNFESNSYFTTNNAFVTSVSPSTTGSISLNSAGNKYFRSFYIVGTDPLTIQTRDDEGTITMQAIISPTSTPIFSVLKGS